MDMMYKIRKRYRIMGIVLVCVIAISLYFTFKSSNEERIARIVNNNIDYLNECIENKTYDKINKLKSVKKITPYPVLLSYNWGYFCNVHI